MDGNEGCYIARWTNEGHMDVARGYDMSTMDRIMLRYRPIAPKPASVKALEGGASDVVNISPRDGRHAKAGVKGRKKCAFKENNNNSSRSSSSSSRSRRKRKSGSPQDIRVDNCMEMMNDKEYNQQVPKGGVTLLPLFPEAPDLSPTVTDQASKMPVWLTFDTT